MKRAKKSLPRRRAHSLLHPTVRHRRRSCVVFPHSLAARVVKVIPFGLALAGLVSRLAILCLLFALRVEPQERVFRRRHRRRRPKRLQRKRSHCVRRRR